MLMNLPFQALNNAVAVATPGTANVATAIPGVGRQVLVDNQTDKAIFFSPGLSTADVTTNFQYALAAGKARVVTIGPKDTHIALKASAASAGSVYLTRGDGALGQG